MRPYGQKRVYGKGLWTFRAVGKSKIHVWMPTKNRKAERARPLPCDEY